MIAVPFAPRWPYEVQVLARRHGLRRLGDLTDCELIDLAGALHDVVGRYDALFDMPLPFVMCIQEAPAGGDDWHLHVEFMPPHRAPDRLKVRASVETSLGVFINDTLPEQSASRLADLDVAPRRWDDIVVPLLVEI